MDYKELEQAMADLDEDTVLDMMKEVMDNNGEGVKDALEACQKGMAAVGSLFEKGEYFVGDLIYAGEIMVEAMDIIKPALAGADHKKLGRMILCTVKDDLHDIGKNLVVMMLKGAGFEIIDLGTDVPAETFVDKAEEIGADVIGMSALLTTTMPNMKEILDVLEERGLREKYIVMVGGAPVNQAFADQIGADYYTEDAASAAEVAKEAVLKRKAS